LEIMKLSRPRRRVLPVWSAGRLAPLRDVARWCAFNRPGSITAAAFFSAYAAPAPNSRSAQAWELNLPHSAHLTAMTRIDDPGGSRSLPRFVLRASRAEPGPRRPRER
jgi:hypothetical protein